VAPAATSSISWSRPVLEIRGFDGDFYYVHNAYRSPGHLNERGLGKAKAEVYRRRYDNFRKNLKVEKKYIDRSSAADLEGVTIAFVCVDKGSARAEIFELLISLGIPFVDIGMGLNRKEGPLAGTLPQPAIRRTKRRRFATCSWRTTLTMSTAPRSNFSELNAMNACLAVMRYKQLLGFYLDKQAPLHAFGYRRTQAFLPGEPSTSFGLSGSSTFLSSPPAFFTCRSDIQWPAICAPRQQTASD
jgi:hypothetical protein